MRIFLLRHGETDYNREAKLLGRVDVDLNGFGSKQAEILGARISAYGLKMIYSSDLKRALQTAEAIQKYSGAEILATPLLREINKGNWQGLNWDEIKSNYPKYYAEWSQYETDVPYPNGECGNDVLNRFYSLIKSIDLTSPHNIAMVTHSGLIKTVVSNLLSIPLEKRFAITVWNCSISELIFDSKVGRLKVLSLNDTAHFEPNFDRFDKPFEQ